MKGTIASMPSMPTVPGMGGNDFDPAAEAFFSRTGALAVGGSYSEAAARKAINDLVIGLRNAGLWSKMIALYPFCGGNSTSQAQNLAQNSFNITWVNSPTFNGSGVTGNGSTTYGNTGLSISALTLTNFALHCYVNNADGSALTTIGAFDGVDPIYSIAIANGSTFGDVNDISSGRLTGATSTPPGGTFTSTRRSASDAELYEAGASIATKAGAAVTTSFAQNLYVIARNDAGSPGGFYTQTVKMAGVSTSFSDTDAANFNTLIVAYQTALGRA